MIAVVTGTGGFIGSHLVDALLARGVTVRAIVRPQSARGGHDSRVEKHVIDLLDTHATAASPVWNGATHLFHIGGVTKARTPAQFRSGNVTPTANLFAALAARTDPPRVILASSQAAAGPASSAERPVTESDSPRPIEAYGRSKLEAETIAAEYAGRVPAVIVRPPSVYGPRDRDFLLAFRSATSRVAFHAAPSAQQFSILHVDDLIAGLLAAATNSAAIGRTFFLCNPAATTWRELYDTVAQVAGARPIQLQLPQPFLATVAFGNDLLGAVTGRISLLNRNKFALSQPRWWTCSAGRARTELNWHATIDLPSGLRDTYLWYVRAGWLRGTTPSTPAHSAEDSNA